MSKRAWAALATIALAGCAASPPPLPYPAFIAVDELPVAFVAGLPGVRAKLLASDPRTQRTSYRIELPADWSFTTGASPAHSVEIFVLAGEVTLGEFALAEGGYAYLPPGMTGMPMKSNRGALLLYFVDEATAAAVIGTPLITSSKVLEWQPQDIGIFTKELRADPGSGARTWLLRIAPEAILDWQRSSRIVEGYLIEGAISYSECHAGKRVTADYLPGGYFHRPPGAVHGGPETRTTAGATWILRIPAAQAIEVVAGCDSADATS